MEIESGSAGAPVSGAALSRQSADAQTEQRQQLVQFCRSLAQMLQSAEPPSRNAVAEMHKVFQSAMRGRQALSLVAVRTLQDYAIVVDGALDEPVRLAKLLGAGTDDMLVPQLIRQFERAGLFSVTLLGRVALAELTAFVELLTKAGVRDGRELDRRLTEHEVVGIRLLCDADLADADEALGWHTRYLVGRLGKELKRLDRYSETGHGDRGATLAQVIDDIVWSVRRPKPLVDMLLNLDPAVRALQTQPAKLAAAVVSRIPVELAGPALDALAREMSAEQPEATSDRQIALLRLLVQQAAADGRGSTAETVEKLVRKGVLKEEEVPGKLRGRLDRRGRARKLLQHGDRHIDALSTPIASELQAASVARNLELYREVAPDVLSLGGISFLAQLCVTLMAMQARPELPQKLRVLIPETLRATARPQLLETLVGMVTDAEIEKERRLHVLKVLRMLGERGVWAMVELLRVSEDRWVRRSTLDALAEMGTSVEPVALSQLERSDNAWYVIRNLLALLEKVGTQASQSAVGRLLEHRDARLRALAVTAYAKLVGKGAMGALLGMIEDANADVRMAVIEQLGRLKCSEPKLTRLYAQIFDLSRDYDARFRMAACVALAAAGNIPVGDSDAETLLCTALASAKRGFLGLGRKKLLEPQVQEVMCRVLGIFGGKKAREVLAPIAKRDQTEVGDAARNALAEIEGRSSKR